LLNFYQSYNMAVDLLKWAISQQIKSTTNAEELFREGSIATTLLYHFFHIDQMGTRYLHTVLQPLVKQIEANRDIHKIEKDDSNADRNLDLMFSFLNEFMERLITTVVSCPLYIREGFLFFKAEAAQKFPESKAITPSILFLRFILPALVSPHKFAIWSEPPGSQKGLILAARILQSIANLQEFEHARSTNAVLLNVSIMAMFPKMNTFIASLLDEEQLKEGRTIIESSVSYKPNISEREAALQDLFTFLEAGKEEGNVSCQGGEEEGSITLVLFGKAVTSPNEMLQKALSLNNENWKLLKTNKIGESSLYTLRADGTALALYKTVSHVDWPYKVVYDHLWNFDRHSEFASFVFPNIHLTIIKRHGEFEYVAYNHMKFPFPLANRDILVKKYAKFSDDPRAAYVTWSSIKHDHFPETKDFIRMHTQLSAQIMEPEGNNKCKLTILYSVDLNGALPNWLKNLFGTFCLSTAASICKWAKEHQDFV